MQSYLSTDINYITFSILDYNKIPRTIRVLLPTQYHESKNKNYPVIYLQDGQNLFFNGDGFGSWKLDKSHCKILPWYRKNLIIVGIDHLGKNRIEEFNVGKYFNALSGPPFDYMRFVFTQVKPTVDQHFRTLPDKLNTAVGGSSMGALISLFSALYFPDFVSKMMVFSPSLWINPSIFYQVEHVISNKPLKAYLYGGGKESKSMIPHCKKLEKILKKNPNIQVKLRIQMTGRHQEKDWGREFTMASKWLFAQ